MRPPSPWPLLTTFCFEQGALAGAKVAQVVADGPGFGGARLVACSEPTVRPGTWTPATLAQIARCRALTRLRLGNRAPDEHFSFFTVPRLRLEYLAWNTRREWPPVELGHEISGWPGFFGGWSRAAEHPEWESCLYNPEALALEPCRPGRILPDGSGLGPGEIGLQDTELERLARRALEAHADRLGVSVAVLRDRSAPSFGLPRSVEGREVRITPEFQVGYYNPQKGRIGTLPPAATAAQRAEHKALWTQVESAGRGQTAGLERLLVERHGWTVSEWRERYLSHPLLRACAVRLVWGNSDGTFRPLPDGTLVDAAGLPFPLGESPVRPGPNFQ